MKNYFAFSLTGKKMLPIWLLFLVLFIAPYIYVATQIPGISGSPSPSIKFLLYAFLLLIVAYLLIFFFIKLTIENIVFEGKNVVFNGTFGVFAGKIILGFFLTLITIGIYSPWFIKNITKFFAENSSYDSDKFEFRGKGSKLFVIILLCLILPCIIIGVIVGFASFNNQAVTTTSTIVTNIVSLIITIPFSYLFYNWTVDFGFKGYQVKWETEFWPSCGKIALEMLLTIITLGIYSPMMMLKLYKYFVDKTVAISENKKMRLGYDSENVNDFLFIWGQILLSIITLMIYYPWAYSKIGKLFAGKTYLEEK